MPFKIRFRSVRVVAAGTALLGLVGAGLADWSDGSSGGYVVQPGDSLWAIATAHHVTVAQLASANSLDPAAILPIGRHLYIPGQVTGAASAAASYAGAGPGSSYNQGSAAWSFCSSFVATPGPWGVLPDRLAASPDRLALQPYFQEWAAHYGLSLPLLEAIDWQESGWQQGVVSPTGAIGVGQIEPATARFVSDYLVGINLDPNSVSDNIRMSAAYLAYLAHIEGNSECATIAAYYEGPLHLASVGVYNDTAAYVASVEALVPRFE